MKTYLGVNLAEKRQKLLKSEAAKKSIDEIINYADNALSRQYPPLTYSDYMIYKETGSRIEFEQKYFIRRKDCAFLIMALYITNDEKYIKPLYNLIFAICDEFSWCVPAHATLQDNPSAEYVMKKIDLFQAETARLLCDAFSIFEDMLPYLVCDRIKYEVRRRVIEPMMKTEQWWFGLKSNWAAVCAGSTAVATMTFGTREEKDYIIPILDKCIDNYISGFTDDGCCTEGYSYWNYGFGYFMIYAQLMNEYSGGKIEYFKDKKVKRIALFPQKVRLGESRVVCFSDCQKDFFVFPGVAGRLKEVYGDEFACPDSSLFSIGGTVPSIKEILWFDTEYKSDNVKLTSYFPDSQWFIKQGKNYSFAAKGGHNNEEHNHNDVGSFMVVCSDDSIPLTDLGNARYCQQFFDPSTRYLNINCGSHGHSVPIINGKAQNFGEEFRATNVICDDNSFTMDIENAYDKGIINKITRKFELMEKSIVLTDSFIPSYKTQSITERFVSETKPSITEGCVSLNSACIIYDNDRYEVKVSTDSYLPHNRSLSEKDTIDVYLIDFTPKKKFETEFKFEIKTEWRV